MLVICTGQTGLNKSSYVDEVCSIAKSRNNELMSFHVGSLMYQKDKTITKGRILSLPYKQLQLLRDSVFHDISKRLRGTKNAIINTHATFRWDKGLFSAFTMEIIQELKPDIFITFVDDIDQVKLNLRRREESPSFALKDIIIWREEEMLATEILASSLQCPCYIVPMKHPAELVYKLLFHTDIKKVYISFPISHVLDNPALLKEINSFRSDIKNSFVAFDPYAMEEKRLVYLLRDAEPSARQIDVEVSEESLTLDMDEIRSVVVDIDGQIVSRDFKMIDQSDMIIAFIPDLGGKPVISSGVERELQHAYDATKSVYVIWTSPSEPSPFVKQSSTEVFDSINQAREYFVEKGWIT